MKPSTIQKLLTDADDYDRDRQVLASAEEITIAEITIGVIHPSYRSYLTEVGFESIGAEYFDRITQLIENYPKIKDYCSEEAKGKMPECFVFHWDGCGNPVGLSRLDNKIYVDDDVFGEGMLLAESIDEYIEELLSENDE